MNHADRVVTAKLPADLVSKLDKVAGQIDRSKSWIIRQALSEWLSEHQRRDELTLEAMKSVDEGRVLSHDDVMRHFESKRASRAEGQQAERQHLDRD